MEESDITRAKMLGVLIRDAREHAGRSVTDCAQAMGLSDEDFEQAEQGDFILSLPHLEALAIYLQVPLSHFWGESTLTTVGSSSNLAALISLRHRMIGVLLMQARQEQQKSLEAVAEESGIAVATIDAYEKGLAAAPLFHLEQLGRSLGVSLNYFLDDEHGPLARHEKEQKIARRFQELPPEVRAFVTEPVNIRYLETAMRLSDMDVNRLRGIAESILDITY